MSARPDFLFHGTLAPAAAAIARDGLRFRRHEPCFTLDLLTACLVYGAASQHPHVPRAAADDPDPGAFYVVWTKAWRPRLSPTTCIWTVPGQAEVRGGISKWMGSYFTLYPEGEPCSRDEMARRFREGTLRDWPSWKRERSMPLRISPAEMAGPVRITPAVHAWLLGLDQAWRGGVPQPAPPDSLRETLGDVLVTELLRAARTARASRWIRRLALSILRDRGFRIVAADVEPAHPVADSVLWAEPEQTRRREALTTLLARPDGDAALLRAMALLPRLSTATPDEADRVQLILQALERLTTTGAMRLEEGPDVRFIGNQAGASGDDHPLQRGLPHVLPQ